MAFHTGIPEGQPPSDAQGGAYALKPMRACDILRPAADPYV
jgi:hypothetical protein